MARPVVPLKRIAILCALMFLGLLRAERGTAELQGRVGQPSRLLHISTDRQGTWELSLLGFQRTVQTNIAWPEINWRALAEEAMERVQTCVEQRCGPFQLLEHIDPSGTTKGRPI